MHFLQPVSKGQGRWYFSHLTAERCRRGIRKWNFPQIRARRKKRCPDYQVSSRFLSCTFVERWASNLSTTSQPTAKLPSATGRCHCPRCWVALLIVLGDGRNSLFRTLYNGQTWSSGVRPSCSYEMAGMWQELINRLLVWFPQYVTEKTELTLVYR